MSGDGDKAGNTMEEGFNAAKTSSIHESTSPPGEKTAPSAFHKDGTIGSMFKADGAIGGTAQKVGGPLDKEGAIGQHFNPDGKIGGMVQENLASKK
ncbi:hypothetical protein MMC08_006287 [Hypocenomyce scalaris]|nr:hypothetical protein [Hypocenomyce scalaris]